MLLYLSLAPFPLQSIPVYELLLLKALEKRYLKIWICDPNSGSMTYVARPSWVRVRRGGVGGVTYRGRGACLARGLGEARGHWGRHPH